MVVLQGACEVPKRHVRPAQIVADVRRKTTGAVALTDSQRLNTGMPGGRCRVPQAARGLAVTRGSGLAARPVALGCGLGLGPRPSQSLSHDTLACAATRVPGTNPRPRDALEGGEVPPSRAPSYVSLTANAGFLTDSDRPQRLWQPPPTACNR